MPIMFTLFPITETWFYPVLQPTPAGPRTDAEKQMASDGCRSGPLGSLIEYGYSWERHQTRYGEFISRRSALRFNFLILIILG